MNHFFREQRLIHLNLSDFNDPTKYNSRNAKANAAQQAAQHQAQVTLNQQTGQVPGSANFQTAAPVATNSSLANAQNVYANQSSGLGSTLFNGQVQASGNGVIQQSAIDRLRSAGYTEDQIRQQIGDLQPQIQATASNTGLNGTFDPTTGAYIPPANVTTNPTFERVPTVNPNDVGAAERNAQARVQNAQIAAAQQQYEASQATQQRTRQESAAASSAASAAAEQKVQKAPQNPAVSFEDNAQIAAAQQVLSQTPEGQALMPSLLSGYQAYLDAKKAAEANKTESVNAAEKTNTDFQDFLSTFQQKAQDSRDHLESILEQNKKDQEEVLATNEANDRARLQYQRDLQTQEAERQKTKDLTKASIELALSGGSFSGAGNERVAEAERQWDSTILNLQKEFALKDTEVSAFYTEKYTTLQQNHRLDLYNATQTYDNTMEKYAMQGFSSLQARDKAETEARNQFRTDLSTAQTNLATKIDDLIKEAKNDVIQSKNQTRLDEANAWSQLQWISQVYGTNAPQSLITSLQKKLPGIDVQNILSSPTLAEQKAKKSSGSSGLSFSAYQMKADGTPMSYDDFVNQKKSELKADTTLSIADLKAALSPENLKKEYDAKVSASTNYDLDKIMKRFQVKASTLAAPTRKYDETVLQQYIDAGDYEGAAQFVDNVGDDIDATSAKNFQQALGARFDVLRLDQALKDVGQIGPVTGRLKSLNPYDPAVVRVNNLITQTVPNLARGIFNEVGVLTDSDVERYTKTLGNPKLTVQEAQNAVNDLKTKINVSMQQQIDVWDANRKSVGALKTLFNEDPAFSGDSDYDKKKSDFLSNLP